MVKELQYPEAETGARLHRLPHLKVGPLLLEGRLIGQVATLDEDVVVRGKSLAVGVYEAATGQVVLTRTDAAAGGTIARRNITVYDGLPELFEDLPRILPERDHLEVLLDSMAEFYDVPDVVQ